MRNSCLRCASSSAAAISRRHSRSWLPPTCSSPDSMMPSRSCPASGSGATTGAARAASPRGGFPLLQAIFASGTCTVSPIFRILDAFPGTLIVDEADFRLSDEKAEVVKILNNGNAKGFPVSRSEAISCREFLGLWRTRGTKLRPPFHPASG
jgi:hypothetical protein